MFFHKVFVFVFLAAPVFGQGPTRAAAQVGACQPVFDGLDQIMNTPTHISTTLQAANSDAPRHLESIYAGGAIYQKEKAGWEKMKVTTIEALNQERENRKKN